MGYQSHRFKIKQSSLELITVLACKPEDINNNSKNINILIIIILLLSSDLHPNTVISNNNNGDIEKINKICNLFNFTTKTQ